MKYILDGGPVDVIAPSGLCLTVTDAQVGVAGTLTFTDVYGVKTIPGDDPLPFIFANDVEISGTGEVTVVYTGDQSAYRNFDKDIRPNNAGNYPGHWGSGIGSKGRH